MSIVARRFQRVQTSPLPAQTQTVYPTAVPYTSPDLVGPARGQSYATSEAPWNAYNTTTSTFPTIGVLFPDGSSDDKAAYGNWPGSNDNVFRINWRNLETADGVYNWAPIDDILSRAHTAGRRTTFRIMTVSQGFSVTSGISGNKTALPDWLETISGATEIKSTGSSNYVVPIWNNAAYLSRWCALIAAFGARYDKDERLSVMELSGLGNWGECHMFQFIDAYGGDQFPWTQTTINTIVDAHTTAFSNTQLLSFCPDERVLWYCMNTTAPLVKPIGIRIDSLGTVNMGYSEGRLTGSVAAQGAEKPINRWKKAPMWFEYESMGTQALSVEYLARGRQQAQTYHGSSIMSSNLYYWGSAPTMTAGEWDDFSYAMKYVGYRYRISQIDLPTTAQRGDTLTFMPQWINMGVAPTYEAWTISYALKPAGQPAAADIATTVSSFDLKTLYYDGMPYQGAGLDPIASAPQLTTESITIPPGLAPGSYDLYVKVAWNEHIPGATTTVNFNPMNLAMTGRTSATGGQYPIAAVNIV